ncbi:hypothetical protein AQ505_13305 [Pedobacter sp. PACM 27299]|uniref:DUF6266 family protein n=1 Tax=Pedobacter sp. PACM 27299 TaxID=1727164 RepID=UPI000706029C|nr:DUF6266 family protein [Pedobacter sp. PACM 27299]ALL06389.1 hypothetical protein AQ505_13305 [Pedobacter sp. PACM 27299]
MAICYAGPHGHPSGKIGKLFFYTLNGQPVCRLIGRPGKPSINQLGNRQAMSVTMSLFKPMADFINVSFKLEAEGTVKNPHNLATSYNKKYALTGQYPNIKVDYSKVILSKGSLEMAEDLKLSKGEEGINLSWNTAGFENGRYDDILMVMVSHPDREHASSFLNAAKREDGSCFIPVHSEWMRNGQMEVYVCFKSASGQLISDSAYAGNLNGLAESQKEQEEKNIIVYLKSVFISLKPVSRIKIIGC